MWSPPCPTAPRFKPPVLQEQCKTSECVLNFFGWCLAWRSPGLNGQKLEGPMMNDGATFLLPKFCASSRQYGRGSNGYRCCFHPAGYQSLQPLASDALRAVCICSVYRWDLLGTWRHGHKLSYVYICIYDTLWYDIWYMYIPYPFLQCWSLTSNLSSTEFNLVKHRIS